MPGEPAAPAALAGEVLAQHEPLPEGALRRYGNHLLRHEGAKEVAFVDGGRLLVAASYRQVTVWDPATGELVAGHEGAEPFAGSPTEALYATRASAMGNDVSLVDARHGTEKRRIATKEVVQSLAFSNDGAELAVLTKGGAIGVYEVQTGARRRELRGPAESKQVVIAGGWVAVTHGKAFTLWDPSGDRALEESYEKDVNALRFVGERLIVSTTETATAFELGDLTTQRVVDEDRGYSRSLASNGLGYAVGSREGAIVVRGEKGDVLWGANGPLRALALSPSGLVAALFEPGAIRLFDSRQRREVTPPGGHVGGIEHVVFDAGGTRMASGDDQGLVILWDRASGRLLRRHRLRAGRVTGLSYSPDGAKLAAVGSRGWLEILEGLEGSEPTLTVALDGYLRGVVWDPKRDRLLVAGKEDRLFIVDPATGAVRDRWDLDGTAVTLALSPDGSTLAAGGEQGLMWLLDAATGHMTAAFDVADEELDALAFSPDGAQLAVAWWHRLRVIDVRTGKERFALEGYGWDPHQITWTPDGSRIVLTGDDDEVWLVDGRDGEVAQRIAGPRGKPRVMAVTPDGRELVSGGDDMVLLAWPATDEELARLPDPAKDEDESGPELERLEKRFAAWPTVLAEPRCAAEPHTPAGEEPFHGCAARSLGTARWRLDGDVGVAAVSPDGRLVAGAGGDADEVRVWRLPDGKLVHRFDLFDAGGATDLAFLPDGRLLVAPLMGTVRVYDMRHGTLVDELPWGTGTYDRLHLSADGRRLLLRPYRAIAVHDFHDPGASWRRPMPKYRLPSMSADGRRLLVNTEEEGRLLLDGRTGEQIADLEEMPAFLLRLLPNGDILGLGDDYEVMIGTPEAGMAPTGLHAHDEQERSLQIATDGHTAMLVGDGAIDIVDLRQTSRRRHIPLDEATGSVTLSRDGRLIFVGLSQELAVMPSDGGPRLNPTDGLRSTPRWLAFDAYARLWTAGYRDAAEALPLAGAAKGEAVASSAEQVVSADGRVMLRRESDEGLVIRRTLADGREQRLAAPPCTELVVSADGARLACRAFEGGVSLLDGTTGKRLGQWYPQESVDAHTLSPDGEVVYAVRGTTLHRLPRRGMETSLSLELEDVRQLHLDPTGKHVLVEARERLQWHDATTLERVGVLEHWTSIAGVALSPDGRWVALTTYDDTLELWDAVTKQQRARIRLWGDSPAGSLAWSRDGEMLATAHEDTRILLWRRDTLLGK